jgi:hypothetical protein
LAWEGWLPEDRPLLLKLNRKLFTEEIDRAITKLERRIKEIAVIERFTPWKSFPASIRELRAASGDWRIRRAVGAMRREITEPDNIGAWPKQAGLSRAHFFTAV